MSSPPWLTFELYVAMKTDVVGIQHYSGLVAPKEKVMLQRDPFNPYDSNAVKVHFPAVKIDLTCRRQSMLVISKLATYLEQWLPSLHPSWITSRSL